VLIGDAFEDLADTAKSEREKFREQARKGQFSAIRDVPDRLLNPIQTQLNVIGGAITKIENTILFIARPWSVRPMSATFLCCSTVQCLQRSCTSGN
jgi:hypothetical protein